MKYRITEQNHRTGKTREICVVDAEDATHALFLDANPLPDWTQGKPVETGDDCAFVVDPDDDQHIVSADAISEEDD